jgi:hypothetical protein
MLAIRIGETVQKRLDLNADEVKAAKKVQAKRKGLNPAKINLEEVHFRPMLDEAVELYLPQIIDSLTDAGLKRRPITTKVMRSVTEKTWDDLDAVVEKFDVTKVQIVRALLQLLAGEPADPLEN